MGSTKVERRCIEGCLGNEIRKTWWPVEDTVGEEVGKDGQVPMLGNRVGGWVALKENYFLRTGWIPGADNRHIWETY